MSVQPHEIENAERDLEVSQREGKGARKAPIIASPEAEQLLALRRRIQAALNTTPAVPAGRESVACRGCYQRGYHAALKQLLEG